MAIFTESIIRVSLPKYIVRVWRTEEADYEHQTQGVTDIEAAAHKAQDLGPKALGLKLMLLPRVVSVEILDWNNNGLVMYSEWP